MSMPRRALAEGVARRLDLPEPTLVRVGMNALFRAGDVVVRVGRPSAPPQVAIELAHRLREHGIAAPTPAVGETFVEGDAFVPGSLAATCWEPLATTGESIDWREVGTIVRRVHGLAIADLPEGYPFPAPTSFPWWDFDALMVGVGTEIDDAARAGLNAAIARNAAWRKLDERTAWCATATSIPAM